MMKLSNFVEYSCIFKYTEKTMLPNFSGATNNGKNNLEITLKAEVD